MLPGIYWVIFIRPPPGIGIWSLLVYSISFNLNRFNTILLKTTSSPQHLVTSIPPLFALSHYPPPFLCPFFDTAHLTSSQLPVLFVYTFTMPYHRQLLLRVGSFPLTSSNIQFLCYPLWKTTCFARHIGGTFLVSPCRCHFFETSLFCTSF